MVVAAVSNRKPSRETSRVFFRAPKDIVVQMIGAAFIVWIVGGMFYLMARDGTLGDFPTPAKWLFGIIGAFALLMLVVGLSGNPTGKGKSYDDRSRHVNYCTSGAKLDKFSSGGSQWRNSDGKFCKK